MVYSHIVPECECFELENNAFNHGEDWSRFAALISLRLCCSQINEEVLDCFFTMNPFIIRIDAGLIIDARAAHWTITGCDKDRIPILRYESLRRFRIPYLFVYTFSSVDDDTTISGSIERDWSIDFGEVSKADQVVNPKLADEGYSKELKVEGRVLLQTLVDRFAAETEGPYRGLEANHLEQIIDSMNGLVERKLRAACIKSNKRHGRRRSASIASRPPRRRM